MVCCSADLYLHLAVFILIYYPAFLSNILHGSASTIACNAARETADKIKTECDMVCRLANACVCVYPDHKEFS